MKDYFGKEIVVGDTVLLSTTFNEDLLIGRVSEIGTVRIRVNVCYKGNNVNCARHGKNVVVINDSKL